MRNLSWPTGNRQYWKWTEYYIVDRLHLLTLLHIYDD